MGKQDAISYSSGMNVYSKMSEVDAAKRAHVLLLLDEIQKEDVEPNVLAFNSRYQ